MTVADVPAAFVVRTSTKQNPFSREALAKYGITEESVSAMLGATHRGWVAENGGHVVGFAMGDARNGDLWVIAVFPEHEGKGIGTHLLGLVEDWFWSLGWKELWLWTSPDPAMRAHWLYLRQGWADASVKDGQLVMRKSRPV